MPTQAGTVGTESLQRIWAGSQRKKGGAGEDMIDRGN